MSEKTVLDRLKIGGVKGRYFIGDDNIYKVLDLERVEWEHEPLALEIRYAKPTALVPPRGPHLIPLSRHYNDVETTKEAYEGIEKQSQLETTAQTPKSQEPFLPIDWEEGDPTPEPIDMDD